MKIEVIGAPPRPWGGGRVQAVVKHFCFCVVLISLFAANPAAAQCLATPSAYSAACADIQSYLGTYNSALVSGWHGEKSSTAFGTELLAANDNIGLKGILASDALTRVELELDDLAKLNMRFVTVAVSFPILYQPFYKYNNDPQDYESVVTFYQNVVSQIRQRGMQVLIESFIVFPNAATDLPLNEYYATFSSSQFAAGRAQTATNVAQLLQPDWLNLGSEPDTESEVIGLKGEYTPQQWATEISTIVAQLRGAGIQGKPLIGAGCGAWQQNGSDYIQALMSTGIDYYDLHTFSVNLDYLNNAETYLDLAIAAGKGTAISEVWDHKLTDSQLQGLSEFGVINALSASEPYNLYGFWAPQDAVFLAQIIDLAHWKQLYYVSPFESELFIANLNYEETANLTGSELTTAEYAAEATALSAGAVTPLGLWYAAAIKPVNAATLSAAWNSGAAPVAPGSMVSIYGTGLATVNTPATSLPLPTTLAGASATLTDASGAQTPLPLFFAGPTQINAEIPSSAGAGPAVITINTPSGAVVSPVVLNPVAPSLFSANESGQGIAAAQFVTNDNGTQTTIDIFTSCVGGICTGVPLDVSSGQSALTLYGSGIQNRAVLSDVTVTIANQTLAAFYAGPAPGFTGLDQVNVFLPATLAGSGTVNIMVSVAGLASNTVTATFK